MDISVIITSIWYSKFLPSFLLVGIIKCKASEEYPSPPFPSSIALYLISTISGLFKGRQVLIFCNLTLQLLTDRAKRSRSRHSLLQKAYANLKSRNLDTAIFGHMWHLIKDCNFERSPSSPRKTKALKIESRIF